MDEFEKREWPELDGAVVDEAVRRITDECPGVRVQVVPSGAMVTMEYDEGRVRVRTADGRVEGVPRRG
ncbi:hypothetical protein [Streptomyces sp. NPDC048606]|uniref:hypothetical protein n=1 Tax=Streptomyces sp. NPDC048606 TaxID=3154726 RepID=UPI003421F8A3